MPSQPHFSRRLRHAVILALYTLVLSACLSATVAEPVFRPQRGYVPDERTAIAIAEAVLVPIYGGEQIAHERPFRATLNGNVWEVRGHLPGDHLGGVAVVQISKDDGRILRVYHGQ
jgi:hypothetical protein